MIRVFISSWSRVDGELVHGLTDVIESIPDQSHLPTAARFRVRQLLPAADADGLPLLNSVMLLVNGDSDIESWAALPGVSMLPPFALNQPIADIPATTISVVIATLESFQIPFPAIEGSLTAGDLLDKIIAYYQPDPISVTGLFAGLETDFA